MSRTKSRAQIADEIPEHRMIVAKTEMGFASVLMLDGAICRLKFGSPDMLAAVRAMEYPAGPVDKLSRAEKRLQKQLCDYAAGRRVEFDEVEISISHLTPFQRRVTAACRDIPYGTFMSYGELAAKAGAPKAARAVGSVMKQNRVPIIVPCHRVIASGGKIGGYSAVSGVSTKARLLTLEGVTQFCES